MHRRATILDYRGQNTHSKHQVAVEGGELWAVLWGCIRRGPLGVCGPGVAVIRAEATEQGHVRAHQPEGNLLCGAAVGGHTCPVTK